MADKRKENRKGNLTKRRNMPSKKGFLKDGKDELGNDDALPKKEDVPAEPSSLMGKRGELCYKWLNRVCSDDAAGIAPRRIYKEFNDNKSIEPSEYTTDVCRKNDPKNRYNDILCMDATRVILKHRPNDDDYIHASWMTVPEGNCKFISTQGPTHETIEDFWHMIFTEKSKVIVMVCGWRENNVTKCARYFPKTMGTTDLYGPYKVTWKDERPDPYENIKYMVVEVECGSERTTVHHLANHLWSDHIAPERPTATLGMLKLAKSLSEGYPVIVHCSAGIGRTCTFIGIDYAYHKIKQNPDITSLDILRELRAQRFHAVQSPLQYSFLHACLVELFMQDIGTFKKGREFLSNYARMVARYQLLQSRKKSKAESAAPPQED